MDNEFNPDWAVHPGEVLKEYLHHFDEDARTFAQACGLGTNYVEHLLGGRHSITRGTADKLARHTPYSPDLLLRMQRNYDAFQNKAKERAANGEDDAGPARYLLVKRGLYYRPAARGYTGLKSEAGRYRACNAEPDAGVTAVHENDAGDLSPSATVEHRLVHERNLKEEALYERDTLADRIRELEGLLAGEKDAHRRTHNEIYDLKKELEDARLMAKSRDRCLGDTRAALDKSNKRVKDLLKALKPFGDFRNAIISATGGASLCKQDFVRAANLTGDLS